MHSPTAFVCTVLKYDTLYYKVYRRRPEACWLDKRTGTYGY